MNVIILLHLPRRQWHLELNAFGISSPPLKSNPGYAPDHRVWTNNSYAGISQNHNSDCDNNYRYSNS